MHSVPKNQGILYIIATPIGNLEDISQRALHLLRQVSLILAEDTRHSQKLLQHYQIKTTTLALHEHNEAAQISLIITRIEAGEEIALISDAGTPLISDPGYKLVAALHAAGLRISPIPGPCAFVSALSAAGLPTDEFHFVGFLPAKALARQTRLLTFLNHPETLIFYESPHRIVALCNDLIKVFGAERKMCVAKELSKVYETIKNGTIAELQAWLLDDPARCQGEFVVLVHGAIAKVNLQETTRVLAILLKELPLKQAVALATDILKQPKNTLYDLALSLKR